MGRQQTNVDTFRHRPVNEIVALLPDEQAVDAVLRDLRGDAVDISGVRILHDEEGARILDRTGAERGLATRLVRFFQNLGYDQNILAVYEEGLRAGEALVSVPSSFDARHQLGQALRAHGGHAIIYFAAGTAETLTAP